MESNDQFLLQPLTIIEFDSKCSDDIKNWLNLILTSSKENNGAELLTKFSKNIKNQEIFLQIGASVKRFLRGAEEIGLKKKYKDNTIRDFLVEDLSSFKNSENLETFLSQAECLKIIDYELTNLKIDIDEAKFENNFKINKYDGIINQLKKKGIIHSIFPLHDRYELTKLESIWYTTAKSNLKLNFLPNENIKDYFGESVGFYFSFFQFYTLSLFPFALIGLITWILPIESFIRFSICCIFNLIWSTIFIENWKRNYSYLSYEWGIFDLDIIDHPRPQFYGVPQISPVTNKPELFYSKKRRTFKKYFVSYPIIALSIITAFLIMMAYYLFLNKMNYLFDQKTYLHMILRLIPSILYSIFLIGLNLLYKITAIKLTDWENHRTESSYSSNLTTKLFVFYFANSFMCLFYEAFYKINFADLSSLLISMLVVNAIFNKFTETFGPYLKKKIKKEILNHKNKDETNKVEIEKQAYVLDEYEGLYTDYVTIFEQYGYITLFSAVFPWISLLALANNVMELRSDAFKFCHVNKRPFPKINNLNGIRNWTMAFEILGFISVFTNLALVALHPSVRNYFNNYSDIEYMILFLVIEHIFIILKIIIMYVIPDEPFVITQQKNKYKYESLEALKKERIERLAKKK